MTIASEPPPEVVRESTKGTPFPKPGEPGNPAPEAHPKRWKTIEDGLVHCTAEFRSDLYWGELGLPTSTALDKLRESEDATEPADIYDLRKLAFASLDVGLEQLGNIEHKGIFIAETAHVMLIQPSLCVRGEKAPESWGGASSRARSDHRHPGKYLLQENTGGSRGMTPYACPLGCRRSSLLRRTQ